MGLIEYILYVLGCKKKEKIIEIEGLTPIEKKQAISKAESEYNKLLYPWNNGEQTDKILQDVDIDGDEFEYATTWKGEKIKIKTTSSINRLFKK